MSSASEETLAATRSHVLQVLGVMRAHGARFYRQFMAVPAIPARDGVCEIDMPVGPHILDSRGFVAPGALATLSDWTLGTAIRAGGVGPRLRPATVGLTLQVVREEPTVRVHARAEMVSVSSHMGVAQCRLEGDSGEVLALATGSFAIRPVPGNKPWLPYTQDLVITNSQVPPADPKDLNEEERWLLQHVEDSLRVDGPDGPFTNYLGIEWQGRGDGHSQGIWPVRPHTLNRIGDVQGGAMFGALAAAALACLPEGDASGSLLEQYVQYSRPGRGERLRLAATMLRRGERIVSVHTAATDEEGRSIATSLATLEVAPRPSRP